MLSGRFPNGTTVVTTTGAPPGIPTEMEYKKYNFINIPMPRNCFTQIKY